MAKTALKPKLPTFDELFTTQKERDDVAREKIVDIALSDIDPFLRKLMTFCPSRKYC